MTSSDDEMPMSLDDVFEVENHLPAAGTFVPEAMQLHTGSGATLPIKPLNLGASPGEAAKWLGLKHGRFVGASKYVRAAFIDRKTAAPKQLNQYPKALPASLDYGIKNEYKGFQAYCELMGVPLAQAKYQPGFRKYGPATHELSFLGAAPDALIGNDGLLEIKCPYSLRDDPDTQVHVKDEWLLQAYLQMEAYGRSWCDIIVWHPEYLWLWHVTRDDVEHHEEYKLWRMKRSADGLLAQMPTVLEKQTFFHTAFSELKKFDPAYEGDLSSDMATVDRMNVEWKRWKELCVMRPKLFGGDFHRFEMACTYNEPRTDPKRGVDGLIDRFSNPMQANDPKLKQAWLAVRWTGVPMKEYYVYEEGGPPPPRGGFIRAEYYTYITKDEFKAQADQMLKEGVSIYSKATLMDPRV